MRVPAVTGLPIMIDGSDWMIPLYIVFHLRNFVQAVSPNSFISVMFSSLKRFVYQYRLSGLTSRAVSQDIVSPQGFGSLRVAGQSLPEAGFGPAHVTVCAGIKRGGAQFSYGYGSLLFQLKNQDIASPICGPGHLLSFSRAFCRQGIGCTLLSHGGIPSGSSLRCYRFFW